MKFAPCHSCGIGPCICGEFDTLPSGRGGSGQIRLSPNVALKGAFNAGQGGGDAAVIRAGTLANSAVAVQRPAAFGRGRGDLLKGCADTIARASVPAVAYPFHDTLNTPGAQRNHG